MQTLVKNNTKEILALCKDNAKVKSEKLVFTDLNRSMFKGNKVILNKYFKNESGQDCYYANLITFRNYKDITLYEIKKILKKDFGKEVSLAGYKYNPEHYRFNTEYQQEEYEEDLFKAKSNEEEDLECELARKNRIEPLDFELVEKLSKFMFKALKQRYVLIFGIEDLPGILNNAIECFNLGVSCKPSNEAMEAKLNHLRSLLNEPSVIEWLKTGATDMSLDKEDYIESYQRVLRQITGIRDENLSEYCLDFFHNEEDLWEEDILENNYLETESYIECSDEDEYLD